MAFLLWVVVGSLAGLFIGVLRCVDTENRPPRCGTTWYIVICAVSGAAAGVLIYLGLAGSYYGEGPRLT